MNEEEKKHYLKAYNATLNNDHFLVQYQTLIDSQAIDIMSIKEIAAKFYLAAYQKALRMIKNDDENKT